MKNHMLTTEIWVMILLTALCVGALFTFVDLNPKVDYDVFFSSEDPNYKADVNISKLFPRNDAQIIISVSGDIHSVEYKKNIQNLGNLLLGFDHITDVKSIMHGPKNVKHAIKSPFWSRLLISDQERSSNMIVSFDNSTTQDQIPPVIVKIESLKEVFESEDFSIKVSGFPYIVELIQRHLNRDLRVFSVLAFIVFGFVVVTIFHSWRIFLGMIISCFNAAALTLMITHMLDVKIGILTANLTTIVFVLTLSHIVFLTFNWKHLYPAIDRVKATSDAVKVTLPASFWAMVTTFLGFISLLAVQAKPIRELGVSGAIGTVLAFLMAYGVFPAFLRLHIPMQESGEAKVHRFYHRLFEFFENKRWVVVLIIFAIVLTTVTSLRFLNTDPSLISFFSPKSPITQGLKYIDEHGGSNPLVAVVKDQKGQPLYRKDNMDRLWNLQMDLESHKDVGTVISMPLLLSEARESFFFSFLFTNKRLLNTMDKPKHGSITRGFVTSDYQYALSLLRMNEGGREKHRLVIIEQLKDIIRNNQLTPHLIGGIYALQGHLSHHVATSLIYGLGRLILIFSVIALITSLSLRVALAMIFSICLIPLCILGPISALSIPLDIIAAPAANIAISMGIDAMIHMTHMYRRLRKEKPNEKDHWFLVRKKLWEPILTSMLIVSSGFGIFFLSSFPPTQRFGGSIVLGTFIAAGCALFVFPMFAQRKPKRKRAISQDKKAHRLDHILHQFGSHKRDDKDKHNFN